MFANLLTNWRTTLAGFLITIMTVATVASKTDWSKIDFMTILNFIIALCPALLGLLAVDPTSANTASSKFNANNPTIKLISALCFYVGLGMLGLAATTLLTGCSGLAIWLQDIDNLLPVFLGTVGSIMAAIGVLTGHPVLGSTASGLLQTIGTDIENGIKTLEAMVAEYNAEQSADGKATILGKIEDASQAIIDNLKTLLSTDFGIPASVLAPIIGLAQLLLTEFEHWQTLLPLAKAQPGQTLTPAVTVSRLPMTAKQFKSAHNQLIATSTGHQEIDEANQQALKHLS